MIIFINLSCYYAILLIGARLTVAKDESTEEIQKIVKLGTVVKFRSSILPEIENFSRQEAKLQSLRNEANRYQTSEGFEVGMSEKNLQNPEMQAAIKECKKFHSPIVCSDSTYRTMDGSCNNVRHPDWGKAVTEQRRLLPSNYEGEFGLRKSVDGEELPSARIISLSMTNTSSPSVLVSALFTFFGQFLTHDITLTPLMTENGDSISCCDPSKKSDPFCAPIEILPDDPFYARYNVTCLPFIRSAPYPKCNFDKREVINKKSSFIDASQVYDNDKEHSRKLRTNDGTGKLRTQHTKYGKLMPKNHDNETLFCPAASITKCFEGGDDRTNQHTILIALETIFVRFHNNIAESLHKVNPDWEDDKIFQEARRIVLAIYQNVVYEEYLPLLIGSEAMEEHDLYPDLSRYNSQLDPSVLVEFSAAAFRPHSMVPTMVSGSLPGLKFRNTYSNFRPIHCGLLDTLLAGASEIPSENNDEFQTDDVSHFLYKPPGVTYGGDLTASDIQRGRDVGLPTYTEMIQFCSNGIRIRDFSQLNGLMTDKNADELKNIYRYVDDIDLLIGILRENRGNAAFGPTATCIAAIQFYLLKFGDSYFFTHINGRNTFSREQLESIRTYSMARIICETTEVKKVRRNPFMMPSANNPLVKCKRLSSMNVMPWKE